MKSLLCPSLTKQSTLCHDTLTFSWWRVRWGVDDPHEQPPREYLGFCVSLRMWQGIVMSKIWNWRRPAAETAFWAPWKPQETKKTAKRKVKKRWEKVKHKLKGPITQLCFTHISLFLVQSKLWLEQEITGRLVGGWMEGFFLPGCLRQ